MYNLALSEAVRPTLEAVRVFIADKIDPVTAEFLSLTGSEGNRWQYTARQLDILDGLKAQARADNLWNFFLPDARTGQGLSNLDYAYLAEEMGKNPIAAEVFNCNAPDTGNMEVLEKFGTPEQQETWLKPLLAGEIRSCYAMTEPGLASSDAANIAARAVLNNGQWVINGEKFYITGAGDPRCKIMICMVQTDPEADRHHRQSQILVPMDTPGVEIVGPMHVFGHDDAPSGHMHVRLTGVRVPEANVILGAGRGFEISQARLGPGRIHHCMRALGMAEKALELMCQRGLSREAFGKPIIRLGGNLDLVAQARIDIESARLLVLRAARAMDVLGAREARVWIHAIKAQVPQITCRIIDQAIQMFGAAGLSEWTPLAEMYIQARTLRVVDGPDEVHRLVVGRHELAQHAARETPAA
jgi:acyl-CoA dehydrogenase